VLGCLKRLEEDVGGVQLLVQAGREKEKVEANGFASWRRLNEEGEKKTTQHFLMDYTCSTNSRKTE